MTKPIESAFPVFDSDGCFVTGHSGLTKREYFAALAMQGLLSVELIATRSPAREVADLAVERADALIAALNDERPD